MGIFSSIQFQPKLATSPADVRDNFRRLEPLIHRAAAMGTEFLVLPELCLTGYSFLEPSEAARVCEFQNGPTFRAMVGVAQELKTYLSWGYVEADNGTLFNSSTLVDPDGRILTSYRKVNLWGSDFLWATPGISSAPVVETEFGSTSIVICRDLRDKIPSNIPRIAATSVPLFGSQKLDLVAANLNWGKSGYPSTSWMDFVANHRCTLIVSNRWGTENGSRNYVQEFGQGGSIIIEPSWKCHTGGMNFSHDCVVTAAIGSPSRSSP